MPGSLKQSKELLFALDICRQAGEVALGYFHEGVAAETKADNTPVTIADRQCEQIIRDAIMSTFPGDAMLGEEQGESPAAAGNRNTAPGRQPTAGGQTPPEDHLAGAQRKWIIDPIDGTFNFTRRLPYWSILLALEVDGEIVLGIIHAPAAGETFWAERGGGAFKNGRRLHVSGISNLAQAQFGFGAPSRLLSDGYWEGLTRVVKSTYRQRAFGDYMNFAQVFEGQAEAALEVGLQPWDLAPMKIIAQECGGRYSDLRGGASIYSGQALVSNGLVHDQMLQLIKGA